MCGGLPEARNRKAPTSAGTIHYWTEERAHPTSSIPVKHSFVGSSDKTTPEKSEVATHAKRQDTRKTSSATRPSRRYGSIQGQLRERGGKILQGVKKRLDYLSRALKIGNKVRKSRSLSVTIRTHVGGGVKGPNSENDPAPSALGSSTADKLTALPGEAGHPRANNREPLAQHQQEPVEDIQSMETKRNTTASHSAQDEATKSDAVETSLGPSRIEREPNSSEDKRNTIEEFDSANPYQALGYSPAAEDDAARKQTVRADSSEKLVNGLASPPEPPKLRKWKRSFYMVIHLAKGEDALRVTCLDTGADVNVISIDVVNSLGLDKEQYQGPRLKAIGGTYLPQWQVTLDWHVARFHKTYTSTFAVLDEAHSADFDILLGKKTVEDIGFYHINGNVWFHTANGNPSLAAGSHDGKHGLPSIEVDK
ncbi:MAG: hypothetical protein L6R42_002567 [Xanthoria sp. 1 TBL-2021]|nr:MAG: hypothetical protein L6R42_002567 [Xanthoria sp. 1 TBL-2021]